MAEAFLSLGPSDQKDVLETAAAQLSRPAVILEKDIWICWVLQALFSIPDHHPMAFKGGTSLSKVYGIIDRFSEDIDITLDYRAFDAAFDPFVPGLSNEKIKRFSRRLTHLVGDYVRDVVVPALKAAAAGLTTAGQHAVRVEGECVWFAYPSAVESSVDYLASEVLLEFGGRNVIDPNERHDVVPDMAGLFSGLEYPVAEITVLSPERTFWEKATLIHVECHRRRLHAGPQRLSRHWFDLACFVGHNIGRSALLNRALLEEVVRHKKVFFNASYANYDHCLHGSLRLVPDDDQLANLESDYNAMRAAGIVSPGAPSFEALFEELRILEAQVNRLS